MSLNMSSVLKSYLLINSCLIDCILLNSCNSCLNRLYKSLSDDYGRYLEVSILLFSIDDKYEFLLGVKACFMSDKFALL